MTEPDFVIVGGGIAGGALATVMARAGASVLVFERQPRYQDHVRGEILWSWGVQVARRLGIEQTLLNAGALVVRWLDSYDEGAPSPDRTDASAVFSGINGSLNLSHPTACAALADAAVLAGADVRMGVRQVHVAPGKRPLVRWTANNGEEQQARAEVVIGADGRRSSVRSQVAIPFQVDPPAHLIAGMLAEGIEGMDQGVNLIARESDLLFFSFPQGAGRPDSISASLAVSGCVSPAATARRSFCSRAGLPACTASLDGRTRNPPGRARRFPPRTAVRPFRWQKESS
jgi:menaquinone-9 beta-reductase